MNTPTPTPRPALKATGMRRRYAPCLETELAALRARAERAEAEVERLGHLEAVLRSSAADMTAGSITAGGVADLRAENERLRRAYVRPDDIRAQLESAIARAERAEAQLAAERARLEKMRTLLTASNAKLAPIFGELTAGESRTVRAVLNHVLSIH